MRFINEWTRLLLVGDAWLGRALRWLAIVALLGSGVFLTAPLRLGSGAVILEAPLGVTIAVMLTTIWLSVTAGLAWGNTRKPPQTATYLRHLDDLQAFAKLLRRAVETGGPWATDLSQPLGRWFKSHYPSVATKLDGWERIDRFPKRDRFQAALRREQARLGLSDNASEMLSGLAQGTLKFEDLDWTVENGAVIVEAAARLDRGRGRSSGYVVARVPDGDAKPSGDLSSGEALTEIKEAVRERVPELKSLPEVVAYVDANRQLAAQQSALLDSLDRIILTHRLSGHCEGCPS